VAASFINEDLSFCLFGLLNVACFVQMDIFGTGVCPVLSGLMPSLAPFSPRLPGMMEEHKGHGDWGLHRW